MTSQIDAALGAAVDAGTVPGIVAMAATADELIYEGAFGVRRPGDPGGQPGTAMTRDTVFRIASMTKAITCVAAMQLVEQGKLSLDGPVPAIDPGLAQPQVFTGFDAGGKPMFRPAQRPITLRHLLTHTAGFCHEQWNPDLARCVAALGMPQMASGKLAALRMPLMFDPGERWAVAVGVLRTSDRPLTNDVDLFPGRTVGWGLGFMLTPEPGPDGRSAGSVNWGGIFNTYYWLDPVKRVAGVVMTQILPFADMPTLGVCGAFERGVYAAIPGG